MSDELQVAVVSDPGIIDVPQKQVDVLVDYEARPVVIESPEVDVAVIDNEVHIVDRVAETSIVTVGEAGPKGDPGALVHGSTTGDFIRYNLLSGQWEVAPEPVALKGLVLTPAAASLIDAEGAVYYSSINKTIQVCTAV